MSTLQVVLGGYSAIGHGGLNAVLPGVPDAQVLAARSQAITTSAASQQSSVVAPANAGQGPEGQLYWILSVKGGGVWVAMGVNPVAAPGTTWLLLDAQAMYAFKARAGEKIAVIDAA